MTNSLVLKGRSMGIAFAALVLLALAVAPVSVSAADFADYGDYYGGYGDYGDYGDYFGGYGDYGDYGDYYGGEGYAYDAASYSYHTPSYSVPFSYYTPSYSAPSYAVSSVYAPQNTCTAVNSCNDNSVFNAPTVVTVTDYDNDSDNDDDRDYDRKKKRKHYDYDYDHVSYRTPYVSLTQVPYTGLELGPVGTALYWSFLVVWCLIAAYLIAVKRVQNTILRKLNAFLFGDSTPAPVAPGTGGLSQRDLEAIASMLRSEVVKHAPVAPAPQKDADATDEFVLSQINRARR